MKTLQEKRKELEGRLSRMEDAHHKKNHWQSESSYQDSCKAIEEVYKQLSEVAEELGDPVPVRM